MKILIIEDEKPAARKLIRLLKETDPGIEIVDILESVEKSINWFHKNPSPDLIFMDIQLEDGISFEIFESVDIQIPVIFVTAYDEYTLKAFKVNSVDYLLKPIALSDLQTAVDKFNKIHWSKADNSKLEHLIKQLQPSKKERLLIKIGEHYKSIPISSINCFYLNERACFALTDSGKNYPIDYSLDKIEQLVDSKLFFRVNRSYIINFHAIQDVIIYSSSRLKVILNNWKETNDILVSRERVSDFKEWMDR